MDLASALRVLVPGLLESPPTRAEVEGALETLDAEMRRVLPLFARSQDATPDECEEVIQRVLLDFLRGVMGTRLPETESEARAFLWQRMEWRLSDYRRKFVWPGRPGRVEHDRALEAPERSAPPEADLVAREILDLLRDRIVPAAAAQCRDDAAPSLLSSVDEMLALSSGQGKMSDLIAQEAGSDQSAAALRRARNRIYKNHQRARDRLFQEVEDEVTAGRLSKEAAQELERVIDHLRRRGSGTVRTSDREPSRSEGDDRTPQGL